MISCAQDKHYKIIGEIKNFEGDSLYVIVGKEKVAVALDKGRFKYVGNANEPNTLIISGANRESFAVFKPVNGEVIKLVMNADQNPGMFENYDFEIDGCRSYNVVSEMYEILNRDGVTFDNNKPILSELEGIHRDMTEWIRKYKDEPNFLSNLFIYQRRTKFTVDHIKYRKEQLDLISEKYKSEDKFKLFAATINATIRVQTGQEFLDFEAKDLNNDLIKVKEHLGTYTLIDCWASWCGPCRADLPRVKSIYEQFKDKGFKVITISLDQSEKAWRKAVEDEEIECFDCLIDTNKFNSELVKYYNITGIPTNFLLDKNGKIVGYKLHGEHLRKKLEELL